MFSGSFRERLARGTVIILLGNVIGIGSEFGTRILLANYLSTDNYGLIVFGYTALYTLSLVSVVGLHKTISREIPRSDTKPGRIVSTSTYISLQNSLLIVFVFILMDKELLGVFNLSGHELVVTVFIATVPLRAFLLIASNLLVGLGKNIHRVLIQNVLQQGLSMLLIGFGIWLGTSVDQLALLWVCAIWVASIVSFILVKYKNSVGVSLSRVDLSSYTYDLLVFSFPLLISDMSWTLTQQVDSFLITLYSNTAQLGVYDISFRISRGLLIVIWTINIIFLPILSEMQDKGLDKEMRDLYATTTFYMSIISINMYVLVVYFREDIILWVFGQDFLSGGTALAIISSGFLLHALMGPNERTLIGTGDTTTILYTNIFALSTNVVLNIGLIPRFGITGAAVASLASYIVYNASLNLRLRTGYGVTPLTKRDAAIIMSVWVSLILTTIVIDELLAGPLPVLLSSLLLPLVTIVILVVTKRHRRRLIIDRYI